MAKASVAERLEEKIRADLPPGTVARIEVLEYGDAPEVEPGQTAVRVFLDRSGRPEGKKGDEEVLRSFEAANPAEIERLRGHLSRLRGWVEFCADTASGTQAPGRGPALRIGGLGGRAKSLQEMSEDLTPVMTRLGGADLSTVDTLIAAGIAGSRAEVLRWAVSRIREHPVYARLEERVREIDELKAEF